jgi:hypothetical protein
MGLNNDGNNNGTFRTTDTPLAAYLYTKDIRLLDIDVLDNGRGAFLFEKPPAGMVDLFWTGKAEVSALLFHKSYRYLIKQVETARNNGNNGGGAR